jgi:extracellular elastinolytic metalloproteinase
MKKITLLILFLIPLIGFSQSNNEKIQSYLNANHGKFKLTVNDVNDWVIESERSSTSTNINNYYVKQRYDGTEISGALSNFWIKNGEIVNVGSRFVSNIAGKVNATTPTLTALEALSKAINLLEISNAGPFQVIEAKNLKEFKISNGALAEDPISAKLVYQHTRDNKLKLAWDFTIYTTDFQHLWNVRIDALDGKMLEKHDMVISCSFGEQSNHRFHDHSLDFTKSFFKDNNSLALAVAPATGSYNVYPFYTESPNHGARQVIVTSGNATASPYGWHDTNGNDAVEYTTTRGNNVWAYDDIDGNNAGGTSPNGGAGLTFDFPYGGNGVAASTYLSAATTNLFYMNNIMHDIFYQYGFNEVNGNFQSNNYGKGGTQGDYVKAEAQDRGASAPTAQVFNNANFSVVPDGTNGRMQMFLWNDAGPTTLVVNSPGSVAGNYNVNDNSFSPGHVVIPPSPGITSNLVLFVDGTPDTSDACTVATNASALNGKIAVIRRGDCTFAMKVKTAQNAGAIAVIIVNNVAGSVGMSGADATITIPAVSMSQTEGEALITAMANGTVNINLVGPPAGFVNADGDFDNGVIAHEYGHGISSRLSGGPGCLTSSEQMGEGWSDFFALMLQLKVGDTRNDARGIGTYVSSEPITGRGIRAYKYSPDMNVNPFTFASTNTMWYTNATTGEDAIDVHSVGSVWATMLWDLTWAYIEKYGFDSNKYTGTGGNNKVLRLVLDAIKLQPCNPSFVSARDAIIAADQATTGGQDFCLIWDVFARRGLGLNASSGTNTDITGIQDQTEDFTTPPAGPNCSLSVDYFENSDMINVYPNPSNGQVNIRINQFVGKVNLQVVDVNGRVVYSVKNDNFNIEKTIDLSHLQSGMYVLKISGEALNYTQKIILN